MAPTANQSPKGLTPIPIGNIHLGGIADSDHTGLPNSVAELVGLDLHSEPGILKVVQKLVKEVGANAPDEFCKERVNATNGCQYWFSSTSGKIWERNGAGTWRLAYTIAAKNGASLILGASEYDGYIYFATQNFVHRIKTSLASASNWSTDVEKNWADLTQDLETRRKASITMNFDGIDDYVSIGLSALSHGDTLTFECWFYVEEDTTDVTKYVIWGAGNTAGLLHVELGGDTTDAPNRNRIAIYAGSTLIAQTDNNAFETGTWNHLAYTRNGSGAGNHLIYVNGLLRSLITDGATNFAATAAIKYIGTRTTSAGFLKGRISNIIIRDNVLTAQQILDSYNKVDYASGSILAAYSLDLSVLDYSGAGNNGTIVGNPQYGYEDIELTFATNLATSLSEKDTERREFIANNETIDYIKVWVVNPGTHNLSVTVHNQSNTLIATGTLSNANLAAGWNYVPMSITGLSIGATYHIHIYASGNSIYVKTNNITDVSDAYLILLSNGDSEFHPMMQQNLVLFIGNKNYIEQISIDLTTGEHVYTARALDFVYPLRAKTLWRYDTDLLVGTYVDNNVNETLVLRWNTYSASWTYSDPVPERGVNAFFESDNFVMAVAGVEGRIYMYDGKNLVLMRQIKGDFENNKQIIVHPNAVALFKTLPYFGVSNLSNNPANQGVYCYGSKNASYPTVLSLEFPISERSSSEFVLSGIEIGAMLVVGSDLYVSWKNGSTCGIDKISYSAKLEKGYITTLVMDPSRIYANNFMQYIAKYWKLPSGTSIDMKYLDTADVFQNLSPLKIVLKKQYMATKTIVQPDTQIKFILVTSGNNSPKVKEFIVQVS